MQPSLDELKEWPTEYVNKLFELVKEYPILYDSKDPQWSNTTLKGQLWTSIAKKLDPNLSSRRCRDKFVTLKKRQISLMKKQMANGDININTSLLWLTNQSEEDKNIVSTNNIEEDKENFPNLTSNLNQILNELNHQTNVQEEMSKKESEQSSQTPLETLEELIERFKSNNTESLNIFATPHSSFQHTESSEASDCDPPIKKQKRKNSAPKRIISVESSSNNPQFDLQSSISTNYEQKSKEVEDECNLIGKLVEIDLRKLSSRNRARARVSIMQIISDLITKEYEETMKKKLS